MGWLQAIFYSTSKNQEGDSPNFDEIVLIYQPIFGREINLPNRSQMMTVLTTYLLAAFTPATALPHVDHLARFVVEWVDGLEPRR